MACSKTNLIPVPKAEVDDNEEKPKICTEKDTEEKRIIEKTDVKEEAGDQEEGTEEFLCTREDGDESDPEEKQVVKMEWNSDEESDEFEDEESESEEDEEKPEKKPKKEPKTEEDEEDSKKGIKRVKECCRMVDSPSPEPRRRRRRSDKAIELRGDEVVEVSCSSSSGSEDEDDDRVLLNFVGNNDKWGRCREQEFRVLLGVQLRDYFEKYAARLPNGPSWRTLRFTFDGTRLDGEVSAIEYGLENGDTIEVFETMFGGH